MATPSELNNNLRELYESWQSSFIPFYTGVRELKTEMFARIFGVGTKGGKNTAGSKLPTKPYSTEELYISPKELRNAPSKFKIGKKDTEIQSLYFSGGYAQLKKETSAKLPLELTGRLKGSFVSEEVLTDGNKASILINQTEAEKIMGLEAKYGPIFYPTKEEIDYLISIVTEEIAEQIKNAIQRE
jgi:hypothetical protein